MNKFIEWWVDLDEGWQALIIIISVIVFGPWVLMLVAEYFGFVKGIYLEVTK